MRALLHRRTDGLVLLGYAAISFAYFGWRLLPHPGRGLIGYGHDPEIYVWSLAWWPHAIGHGMNPFVSHALYAPTGVNLAWTLSVPGIALLSTPLTLAAGPVVAYNVAALLAPALAAWTAYLLCRYLTRSLWASVVGGYLFGFCSFVVRQQLFGNLPIAAVFLFPLVALVVVRYVRGELDARGLAWRFGVLIAAQFWLSTEYAFTLTLALVVGLLLALWLVREARPRIRAAVKPLAAGYALAGVLSAPLVVYAALGYVPGWSVDVRNSGVDLLSFVVPSIVIGVGGSSLTSISHHIPDHGAVAYLALPTLAIVALFARRSRFLLAAFALAVFVVLGTELDVYGHRVVALPWAAAAHVPVLKGALPFRFMPFAALVAAVIVALWTATTRGRFYSRPYLLPVLAVVALVPAVWRTSAYGSFRPIDPQRPAFFADGLDKSCLGRDETVAISPFGFGGNSLLWQAEDGFSFRLASDGLQAPTRTGKPLNDFDADPIVHAINFAEVARPTMDTLLAFAAEHHVDRFLAVAGYGYPNRAQMQKLGPTELVGGVYVAPACGRPSLRTRDLTPFVAKYQSGLGKTVGWCTGVNYNEIPRGLYAAGLLRSAKPANYFAGQGLTCSPPPADYKRRGFASPDLGVPADTYPYYAP